MHAITTDIVDCCDHFNVRNLKLGSVTSHLLRPPGGVGDVALDGAINPTEGLGSGEVETVKLS